jgi:hypothetical protein
MKREANMANERNAVLIHRLRSAVEMYGLPYFDNRKFDVILDALQAQIENNDQDRYVINCLCSALMALAANYPINTSGLADSVGRFLKSLESQPSSLVA